MNYTENYQLPQWVASDRVLMEDFNAANMKVDQALAGLAGKDSWEELAFYFAPSAGQVLSTNVPTAEIIQQQLILIRVSMTSGAGYLKLNGGGARFPAVSGGSWLTNGILEVSSSSPGWVLIPIGKTGSGKISGIGMGLQLYYIDGDISPSAWSTMSLTSVSAGTDLPFGTTIQLWGCR